MKILLLIFFSISCSNPDAILEYKTENQAKSSTNATPKTPIKNDNILNDILLSDAEAAYSIPMTEGCDNGWIKIRGGGPNSYYYCINPYPQTERYDRYLDIPHQEINGDNVDKIYDYASICAEMGADWCTVQELMAANKIGAINLSAQTVTYNYDETCSQQTSFSGSTIYARYPSRFCMEKEALGGASCAGKYFFSKYEDPYVEECESAHENREFYGWHHSSYSWVSVKVYCCYR